MTEGQTTFGVETIGISKRFGALAALSDVSIKVEPGTVHALLGENGAGKSTLVKCIMGYYRPDDGSVLINNREYDVTNPQAARALKVGMVYQHFTLVPGMTVLENLVLAREDLPGVIDWRRERKSLEAFLDRMPFRVPLDEPAARLAAGEKQKAEILKQLYLDQRFLILDEPTSVLTPGEADEMLGMLKDMTRTGSLTILMITHKFREVMAFADAVSVLRRGRYVGGGPTGDFNPQSLALLMVGDTIAATPVAAGQAQPGAEKLVVDGLTALDDAGETALEGVSLAVKAGEIVGIAGVSGNGQRELVEVLAGQRVAESGQITIDRQPYSASRSDMRRHRVSCLPEEPLRNACVAQMSVAENLALRDFDQPERTRARWFVDMAAVRARARDLIQSYRVKTPGPDAPIGTLSGGNVQRAVLGREMAAEPEVLIVANPCFGLDFKAVADIRGQIAAARARGAAVLLVSEDLDEILELADRILVMSDGRVVYQTPRAAAELSIIGQHMAGHG